LSDNASVQPSGVFRISVRRGRSHLPTKPRQACQTRIWGRVGEGKGRCGGRMGRGEGKGSDMEMDECDPLELDNSPMLAGLGEAL